MDIACDPELVKLATTLTTLPVNITYYFLFSLSCIVLFMNSCGHTLAQCANFLPNVGTIYHPSSTVTRYCFQSFHISLFSLSAD